ncbi:hypothetical protein D3C81_926180 [compost metagenome]
MQVIAGIKARQQAQRIRRIAQYRIGIDDGIENAGTADPVIQLPTQRVLLRMVVIGQGRPRQCSFERRQRRADHAYALPLCLPDDLQITGLQLRQAQARGFRLERRARPGDVIDADQHHHRAHARLAQYIALHTRQGTFAHAVTQQAAA